MEVIAEVYGDGGGHRDGGLRVMGGGSMEVYIGEGVCGNEGGVYGDGGVCIDGGSVEMGGA